MDVEEPTWGLVAPEELERLLILSPHFDDAAMGAGHLAASHPGTTVLTVFAGRPPSYPAEPTAWDAEGGFVAGDDVVATRREEDLAALAVLGADHAWLEFCDHQYLAPPDRPGAAEVARSLVAAIDDLAPTAVVAPMGLGNPDHVVTHEAALAARQARPGPAWFCYEDHGYKHVPGLLAWRVARLLRSGPWATPAIVPVVADEERKRRAIWCYASQIAPLEREHALSARVEAGVPEQFWRLAPPPRGWEGLADLI